LLKKIISLTEKNILASGSDEEPVTDSFKCKIQYFMPNILSLWGRVIPALAWAASALGDLLKEGVSKASLGQGSQGPIIHCSSGRPSPAAGSAKEALPTRGTGFGFSHRARARGKRGTASACLISIK